VSNVQVTAQSSDGQLYTAGADCGNGSPSTYVPTNPVPYTYGQVSCHSWHSWHLAIEEQHLAAALKHCAQSLQQLFWSCS
jgi:hypothetical protein